MESHKKYMQRCIELAKNGLGNTYPNPLVGSVIVHNGKIIGEGYHTKAGMPHAEINAINSVKDKSLLKKSTIYVSLEPCSHFGRTPPCALKIAELGIPKVVIGTIDTTDKVRGKGVQILKNAGIDVTVGILENEARQLNRRFFTYHEKKRPYIILKWAQTADGFLAPAKDIRNNIEPYWISGQNERALVHKWRTEEQAILIGRNTLEFDNPQLNARFWTGDNPIPIVIGSNIDFKKNYNLFSSAAKVILFSHRNYSFIPKNVEFHKIFDKKNTIKEIMNYIYKLGIQSVIVEGGAYTHKKFIENNLWDEARIFVGKKFFGKGIKIAEVNFENFQNKIEFKNSTLYFFKNNK